MGTKPTPGNIIYGIDFEILTNVISDEIPRYFRLRPTNNTQNMADKREDGGRDSGIVLRTRPGGLQERGTVIVL